MNESGALSTMHLRELAGFAAAARRLNFARAAHDIGCTPSVLSRRIAALERRIGGPLFLRSTRRAALTPLGETLLAHCAGLEAALAELNAELAGQRAEPAGNVHLHLPLTYGRRRVAPLLPELLAQYPRLRLDVSFDDAYVDLIETRVDVALRIGAPADSRLVASGLAPIRRFLCAAPAYLDHAPPLRHPDDLKAHRCLTFRALRRGDLWDFTRGRQRCAVRVQPVLRTDNADALRDAAVAGSGIALLSDFIAAEDLAAGRLREVLPEWPPPQPAVQLLWCAGADRAPRVRAVIEHLRARLGTGAGRGAMP